MMKHKYKRSEYDSYVYLKGLTVEDMVYILIQLMICCSSHADGHNSEAKGSIE